MNQYICAAAILPAIILIWFIYRKDRIKPEPPKQLIKGFIWGILSAIIAIAIAMPLMLIWNEDENATIIDCLYAAFCTAAIPEECAKALCLWLFLRKNKYFDEYMDGIVYAVAVGMGFAGFENVLYLFNNTDNWISLGIARGLLTVPGHFAFAVLMGYYFSLWRIKGDTNSFRMMLIAPILAHGIFDFLLFYMNISEFFSLTLVIVFFVFLHKLRKYCSKLIGRHLQKDSEQNYV